MSYLAQGRQGQGGMCKIPNRAVEMQRKHRYRNIIENCAT